jgi:hypothetical protein
MTRFRRLICACLIAVCGLAGTASAASGATFYVSQRGGEDTNPCTEAKPCETIQVAIARSEGVPGPNTIQIENEGSYENQTIDLTSVADKGLTINGEAGVELRGKAGTIVTVHANAGKVTIAKLAIIDVGGAGAAIADSGAALTLNDVEVENQSGGGPNGVEVLPPGSLTINGGSVVMENGTGGSAVLAKASPLVLNETSITAGGGGAPAEAGAVLSTESSLSIINSKVAVEGSSLESAIPITTEEDGSVQLQNVAVRQEGISYGLALNQSPTTATGVTVKMGSAGDKKAAVGVSSTSSSSFEHLETSGSWSGAAVFSLGGGLTLADSHLTAGGASPAIQDVGTGEGAGLLIQRSVVLSARKATPAALEAINGNVTVDSSEIFGGASGVSFESVEGVRTLTVAASTVAANPGISLEPPGVVGVEALASGKAASTAQVAIEGSIFTESQVATAALGDKAIVSCAYSAIPSQVQTPNSLTHTGEIGCAAGSNGNTNSSAEFASLFAESLKSYKLSPTSSAIDSVPVGAITLPFGLTPSSTDLEGNPRFEDLDCVAFQDKGALQLPGHSTPCPVAVPISAPISAPISTPKPLAGVITALRISPSAFLPAPSGATISRAKKKTKRKYGATISYRDSQQATTTFTVLRKSSGRKQGKSCKAPSKKNKRGKPCTLLSKVGSFTHVDLPAANSLHFSGRLKGKQLPAGTYELQAVAHDGAGNGATVTASFTIK